MTAPRLVVTSGEPAGIGPDLCLQLATSETRTHFAVLGDPALFRQRAQQIGIDIRLKQLAAPEQISLQTPGELQILPVSAPHPTEAGKLDASNSSYVLKMLDLAVGYCLHNRCAAMVTAPVHKGIINDAGILFTGHTEYLAALTGAHPVMLLAAGTLRVALVTTHLPLREVANAVTADKIRTVLRIMDRSLKQQFGIPGPRILVCGLNPHAGEDGKLGHEEITIIRPTLDELRAQGMDVRGPLPADTLFVQERLLEADAVLAMYHDQGLPVLKHAGFGNAVNITLGLPIVRTSVDHGTALDLAGSGKAHTGSLETAIDVAVELSNNRSN